MAVSDIIVLVKSKRPPSGYSFIGEINNHTICVKFSPIPKTVNPSVPTHSYSSNQIAGMAANTPPIPPRPASFNQNMASIEQSYIHVRPSPDIPAAREETPDFYSTSQRGYNMTHGVYNPLQGVPFELNPIYNLDRKENNHLVCF